MRRVIAELAQIGVIPAMYALIASQEPEVSKTQNWPRCWADCGPFQLYLCSDAWAIIHPAPLGPT